MRAKIPTLLVLLLLAGCSSVPSLLYKIEIQQGNLITQELVDKLKPGMTRAQVRFVLGSPLISDAFHHNRWDYVYRLEQRGALVEQRHLTVFFEDDKLVRIDGSFSPSMAFARPQPAEPTSPVEPISATVKEESGSPSAGGTLAIPEPNMPSLRQTPSQATVLPQSAEPIKPVIKEESGVPALSVIAPPSDVPASSSVSASGNALDSSSAPTASKAPVSSESGTPNARRVPSKAVDAGGKGADQPKE
ncbi:MAG: outer membrane protein assembly factor BamE [Pseudomonadota bacterium]|nr:outer membrane protein assembly factor BamE [Pseudomonadota bacterium]